jgi:hypothetical protein
MKRNLGQYACSQKRLEDLIENTFAPGAWHALAVAQPRDFEAGCADHPGFETLLIAIQGPGNGAPTCRGATPIGKPAPGDAHSPVS